VLQAMQATASSDRTHTVSTPNAHWRPDSSCASPRFQPVVCISPRKRVWRGRPSHPVQTVVSTGTTKWLRVIAAGSGVASSRNTWPK
jgi:hypothetical protein